MSEIGLIGKKIGMTRIFSDDGTSLPVTVVDISENTISQVKTFKSDGFVICSFTYTLFLHQLIASLVAVPEI